MVLKDHPTLPPTAVEGWELRPGEFKGFDRAVNIWLFHVQSSLAGYATATMVPAAILSRVFKHKLTEKGLAKRRAP